MFYNCSLRLNIGFGDELEEEIYCCIFFLDDELFFVICLIFCGLSFRFDEGCGYFRVFDIKLGFCRKEIFIYNF